MSMRMAPLTVLFHCQPQPSHAEINAFLVDPAWLDYGVPILGICYGMQELAYRLSPDNVIAGTARE